jgi:hypothetical protein
MPDYRSQFTDNQRSNAGTAPSATATADLAGSTAVRGVSALPALTLSAEHARARIAAMQAEKQRYINDPPPHMSDTPEAMRQHRAYRSMETMEHGYVLTADKIVQAERDYQLATAPAYSANASIARAHAIGGSLAFEGEGESGRTEFSNHLSRDNVQRMMANHPELAAANASVEVAGGRFMVARGNLRAKTIAYRGYLAQNVIGELRTAQQTATDRRDAIEARIARVNAAISALGSVASVVSGNLSSLEGVGAGIGGAMDRAGSLGQHDGDHPDHDPSDPRPITDADVRSAQQTPLVDRQIALTQAFEQALMQHDYQRDAAPRVAAQQAEDHADRRDRQHRTAARNGETFREIDRAHRRGEEPNLGALHARHGAQDVAAGRTPTETPHIPNGHDQLTAVGTGAGHVATGLGVVGNVADAAMRMYYGTELRQLSAQINAVSEQMASWEEIRAARAHEALKAEYDTAVEAYDVEGMAYEAAIETRREHYQHLGLLLDREQAQHAPPGAATHAPATPAEPTNQQDINSQAMLYLSAESEANARLALARRSVETAQGSVNDVVDSFAHRRNAYETRDSVWGQNAVEPRGPDEGIAHQMQSALAGWLEHAAAEAPNLESNALSGRRVMGGRRF